jgi:hypothetical protein
MSKNNICKQCGKKRYISKGEEICGNCQIENIFKENKKLDKKGLNPNEIIDYSVLGLALNPYKKGTQAYIDWENKRKTKKE